MGQRQVVERVPVSCDRGLDPPWRAASGGDAVAAQAFGQLLVGVQGLGPLSAASQSPEQVPGDGQHGLLLGGRRDAHRRREGVAAEKGVDASGAVVGIEPFEQPQAQFDLAQQRRLDGCVLRGPDPAKIPGEGLVPAAAVTHVLLRFRIEPRGAPMCHLAACLLPGL